MKFMEDALVKVGSSTENASQIAEVIIDSELRGSPDHGLYFFKLVIDWHQNGTIKPDPDTEIVKDSAIATIIEGDGGCGVVGMNIAVEKSIAKAKTIGMAGGSVRNSGNVIALAPYVQRAAEEGLIAFACSAFRHPIIPPTGGLQGKFGTNPIAYAAPAGKYAPYILDMATSSIAAAKVWEAATNGETIPAGFVEKADGSPLTNATDYELGSSMILPMAGARGYGLALMSDIFGNVLAGSDWGHFIWLLNPGEFRPADEFSEAMDVELDRVKSGKKKPGVDEIYYPGERSQRRMAKLRSEGIVPLGDTAWQAMEVISERLGVKMPSSIS
jgi:LDH2 family malate/lactate/ureidoglycolate dehydrogenase